MKIIPAIDILDGKCVRLTKGDYATRKIYNENPLEVAKEFEDHGIDHLHLVDLDGARSKHIVNYKILNEISSKTHLKIDFGGGLKSNEDLEIAFENGASQITGGSVAVQDPGLFREWIKLYGANRIILGADCNARKIVTQGWLERSEMDVLEFIQRYEEQGITSAICTDVSKDGMLQGTSNDLYKEILAFTKIKLIASGGVSCVADLKKLRDMGCAGAIIGKAIYEGKITLKELKELC
ncbi:1-(5-phosphoribosyl)-5-[(5-phosphoribosylamino)methylideneamino]imidazole-4-carboxamide isomerase [Sphingobacteriaceae bacterium]|nr:1-(5-phosphoribosyl)-5-[(5-phosphoribosylamino)methylideneamino]imidazole-4-carboxamide isomerase [Sphingobacteriaceae bacterium]